VSLNPGQWYRIAETSTLSIRANADITISDTARFSTTVINVGLGRPGGGGSTLVACPSVVINSNAAGGQPLLSAVRLVHSLTPPKVYLDVKIDSSFSVSPLVGGSATVLVSNLSLNGAATDLRWTASVDWPTGAPVVSPLPPATTNGSIEYRLLEQGSPIVFLASGGLPSPSSPADQQPAFSVTRSGITRVRAAGGIPVSILTTNP
jgi:hypothetical protein